MLKIVSTTLLCALLGLSAVTLADDMPTDAAERKQKQAMRAMQHANPVPNYMVLLKQDPADLKLTAEQKTKLDKWFQENNAKSAEAVKNIIAAEKALAQASLEGKDKAEIMKQADAMLAMRRAMIEQKTNCLDHIREVLSPEQWTQLLTLQKQAMEKKQNPAKADEKPTANPATQAE